MGRNIPDEEIQKLIEWEEHQFNPGYWVNRFSPFFPHKRTWGIWIIALIDFLLIIPGFIIMALGYIDIKEPLMIVPVAVLGFCSIAVTLRVIMLKPPPHRKEEGEALTLHDRASHSRREKKLAKKRKDYK